MKKVFAYSAIITAYNSDETINYNSTRQQIRRQIAKGNHILCCGTNGDFSSLLTEEKLNIIKICVEEADSKVKVIANAGSSSTYQTLKLSNQIAELGVNGIAVINPYFISCTQEGLYAHYSKLADSIKLPVYIYDIPARTHNGILPETVSKLFRHENIVGIKDSSGNKEHLDAYCEMSSDSFEVLTGSDALILYGLKKGASGCVSGLSNIVPEWVNDICTLFEKNRLEEAENMQNKLIDFRTELYNLGYGPALVKRSVYILDPSVGNNRSPSLVPGIELDEQLTDLLDKYQIKYS